MYKKSPYHIDEDACISFSGGRTSAYMLYKILQAHGGTLPNHIKCVFANTGKEMPQTLDFVNACSVNWGVKIHWVELKSIIRSEDKGKVSLNKEYHFVDYKSASRNGEPFDIYLTGANALPTPVSRACTSHLKVRAIIWANRQLGIEKGNIQCIGIRADEQRRASKINPKPIEEGQERYLPLYWAGVDAPAVGRFWRESNFDLDLPNNNGVTDWGNCDLCYLKAINKKMSIIRERPELADWWDNAEQKAGIPFRIDHPSYKKMKIIASDQGNLFDFSDDKSISCYCGD